jgi:hypothetical protein
VAGETQNYHETRDPYFQSADFGSTSPITTSISMVPILRVPATNLAFPAGYWLKPGRRWHIVFQLKVTTAATPGNFTFEIRHQTGAAPTDAGGTILATSAATAFTLSKTNITAYLHVYIEARGDATTFVPTATPLYAYGYLTADGTSALITSPGNPIMIPASAAAAVNIDGTLAGTIHVDAKRSGSTAETIVVQDLAVNAMT